MTNPNNAIGTNGAFGGRTSVNAFNDVLGAFQSRGVLSGWGIVPSSGMTVACGGNGTNRDVAIAEDTNGNKTTINNISGAPINVTLDSAPASNSRYDAIVVYVDKPPTGNATQDNPECCGIIKVTGTAASTPAYPNDSAIRSAITADGASGATAYYAILGYVLVASSTTTITSGMIYAVTPATITSNKLDWTTYISPSTSGGITSYKLGSGILFQIGTISMSTGSSATSDGRYWAFQSISFPTPFKDSNYYIEAEAVIGTGSIGNNPRATATVTTASQANIGLQANIANYSRDIRVFAIGLWK